MNKTLPASSPGHMSGNTPFRFNLKEIEKCIQGLKEISVTLPNNKKITSQIIQSHGAIRLGTMLIGSQTMYCTDHGDVLSRCHMPYTNGLVWYEGYGGLEHQHGSVVDISRLQNIKQLALLAFPVKQSYNSLTTDFRHTRFLHTYDVIAHGLLCAHNIRAHAPTRITKRI